MYAYIVRRILATIPVMGVVAVFVFLLLHLTPGDPAAVIAGDYARPEDIERIRAQLGLNDPLYIQFGKWLWRLFHGDLGISIFSNLPVTHLIQQRLEPTIMMALTTIVISIAVAVPLGVLAAWKQGTWVDRSVMVFAVLGFSVPIFVVAYAMIWGFSIQLKWLPVQGYTSISEGLIPFLRNIIMPAVALGMVYVALIARITRASVMEVLNEDYIRTARAKGLSDRRVLYKHALRNALIPIVTLLGIYSIIMIGDSIAIEIVFSRPGFGRLIMGGITQRDYVVLQSVLLVYVAFAAIVNLVVDLLYVLIDPRIKLGRIHGD